VLVTTASDFERIADLHHLHLWCACANRANPNGAGQGTPRAEPNHRTLDPHRPVGLTRRSAGFMTQETGYSDGHSVALHHRGKHSIRGPRNMGKKRSLSPSLFGPSSIS
jgi:hypothetical protein